MDRDAGTHPVNTAHLVMGLVFLGLCTVWLAVQAGAVSTDDVRWLLPLPFVFAGAAGLVVFTVARLRQPSVEETIWLGEPRTWQPASAEAEPTRTSSTPTGPEPDDEQTVVISEPR